MTNVAIVLFLLLLGPAAATWLYLTIHNRYRNPDKSHDFEHETAVVAKVIGSDQKVDRVIGTKSERIDGGNVSDHRKRL